MNIHEQIIAKILEDANNEPANQALVSSLNNHTLHEICHLFFGSYRNGKGMKLTRHGHEILKHFYESYEVKFPEDFRTVNKHLIFLDRFVRFPYFLTKNSIFLFDTTDGVNIKIVGGDLDLLIELEEKKKKFA